MFPVVSRRGTGVVVGICCVVGCRDLGKVECCTGRLGAVYPVSEGAELGYRQVGSPEARL